jgi:hypothetical protein
VALFGLGGVCAAGTRATEAAPRPEHAERLLSAPAQERPLALAFAQEDRLLAVTPRSLRLFKIEGSAAVAVADLTLPGPRHPVRAAAALLTLDPAASTAWVLTDDTDKACLVSLDGDRLSLRAQADALPWPGSPLGLRYREGTNWIEGSVEGLGPGPFLALLPGPDVLAVTPEGRLHVGGGSLEGADGPPNIVGPTLARLWPGAIVASTPRPPGSEDAVLVLERQAAGFARVRAVPMEGAIRAIASRRTLRGAVLAVSVEANGGYELWRLRLEGP